MTGFFADQGLFINGIHHLSPREALAAIQRGAVLVDIREEYETGMKAFDVPGLVYLANSCFREEYDQLPHDKPLIIADSVGLRSKLAVQFLHERGRTEVANLNGGILDWETAGMPTRVNPDELWTGSCACKLKPRKNFRIAE